MKKILLIILIFWANFAAAQNTQTVYVNVLHGDTLFQVKITNSIVQDSVVRYKYSSHYNADTLVLDTIPYMYNFYVITNTVRDSVQMNKLSTSQLTNGAGFITPTALVPYIPKSDTIQLAVTKWKLDSTAAALATFTQSRINDTAAAIRASKQNTISVLPFANGGLSGSAATPATTGTMTVNMTSSVITITPSGNCTFNASGGVAGQIVTFSITTSGTTSRVLTFGTNFRKTGTLATGTVSARFFAITFRCIDGTIWQEISRTIVQT